jgi:hypothetical protein
MLVTVIISGIVFSSCNKNVSLESHNETTKTNPVIDPSYQNNIYDSIGINHNQMLSDFINNKLLEKGTYCLDSVFTYFGFSNEQKEYILIMEEYLNKNHDQYSPELKELYDSLPDYFMFYYDIRSIATSDTLGLYDKIEKIKLLEKTFDMTGLSSELIAVLYKTSSVARYSLYFWAPTSEGGLGYFDLLISNGYKSTLEVNWWDVGLDDLWGAWGSALFTGNPFTALAGGVVNSAISAIRQVV